MNKLLFTEVRDILCALLIQNNRLTAARVLPENTSKIGAIYIAKVKNVVKNIDACFVEISGGELCFLPLKEANGALLLNRKPDGRILQGDELPVQITKDAQKTKQASVTAKISLSNDYFALTLGKNGIGYSNKLSANSKARLKEFLTQINALELLCTGFQLPYQISVGIVVRTLAGEATEEQLENSYKDLLSLCMKLFKNAFHRVCFSCLKDAPPDFETILQHYVYPSEYEEILTDNAILYEQLKTYTAQHFPNKPISLYQDYNFTLTKLYNLESKIKTALEQRIWLKSGGYIIIESTEALTVIDVNSGKFEVGKHNYDAAYKVNLEAATEIALQLRLRNLSGIIIVDFINMDSKEKEEELLLLLRKLVQMDKQKTIVVDMTPLGLVEITRKKEYKPLWEQFKECHKGVV